MVTKAAMGGQRPRTLPGIVVAELALKVAMHTSLHVRVRICTNDVHYIIYTV